MMRTFDIDFDPYDSDSSIDSNGISSFSHQRAIDTTESSCLESHRQKYFNLDLDQIDLAKSKKRLFRKCRNSKTASICAVIVTLITIILAISTNLVERKKTSSSSNENSQNSSKRVQSMSTNEVSSQEEKHSKAFDTSTYSQMQMEKLHKNPNDEEFVISEMPTLTNKSLSSMRMRKDVYYIADPAREGRLACTRGHVDSRNYIAEQMMSIGLNPLKRSETFADVSSNDYIFEYMQSNSNPNDRQKGAFFRRIGSNDTQSFSLTREPCENTRKANIAGRIDGANSSSPTILFLAHYDHLGLDESGNPFCGASDDAASVAILLEIGRVLLEAGHFKNLDIVFLITDAEETNDPLKGVEVFMKGMVDQKEMGFAPPLDPSDIMLAISLDPTGRKLTESLPMLLLVGTEKFPLLHQWLRAHMPKTIGYGTYASLLHRSVIGSTFGNDADKLVSKRNLNLSVPSIWFMNPGMSYYHTTHDCPETLDYDSIMVDNVVFLLQMTHNLSDSFAYPSKHLFRDQMSLEIGMDKEGIVDIENILRYVLQAPEIGAQDVKRLELMLRNLEESEHSLHSNDELFQTELNRMLLESMLSIIALSQQYPQRLEDKRTLENDTVVQTDEEPAVPSSKEVTSNNTGEPCPSFLKIVLSGCVDVSTIIDLPTEEAAAKLFEQLKRSSCGNGQEANLCKSVVEEIIGALLPKEEAPIPVKCVCTDVLCTASRDMVINVITSQNLTATFCDDD